jgi:pantoate--beta-alanine ligase
VEIITDIEKWREYARSERSEGKSIGLVPTMGALHAGHVSLIEAAREHCDVVIVTIFVNPRQFTTSKDLKAYPRTPERDRELARAAGATCVVEPRLEQMWPDFPLTTATTVSVRGLSDNFEGADRPGHFDGVASVVAKLFTITGPCTAFFGEKDFQQLCVIRQLVRDLSFDVKLVGCPIVRDVDGLALSSRNVLLSANDRVRARVLSQVLLSLDDDQTRSASELRDSLLSQLRNANIDLSYADVVNPLTLLPLSDDDQGVGRLLLAATFSGVRLLDNAEVRVVAKEQARAASH